MVSVVVEVDAVTALRMLLDLVLQVLVAQVVDASAPEGGGFAADEEYDGVTRDMGRGELARREPPLLVKESRGEGRKERRRGEEGSRVEQGDLRQPVAGMEPTSVEAQALDAGAGGSGRERHGRR